MRCGLREAAVARRGDPGGHGVRWLGADEEDTGAAPNGQRIGNARHG